MVFHHDTTHCSSSLGNPAVCLEDKVEVLKAIGDGSFGSVSVARVRSAGSHMARRGTIIAIKTMKKSFESLKPCLELREVVFLRTLPPHPHLVPALDIFLDPRSKKLHIAMEYMEGNLYQLMKARDHKPMDNMSVKSILLQIMKGLMHIHDHGFFHRDVKPENVLVSTSAHESGSAFKRYSALMTPPSTPPTYTVKIADFGLAREIKSSLPYTTYVSTRWYRAPEVLLRAGEYSAPVDIWAVGAMAVEIATLKPLFPGGNEVDQVWRVCEIMGSPGQWYSKTNQPIGGGEWIEGTRLAQKLGFAFPRMVPHPIDTILPSPQWPKSFSNFVTWCLMWDPKNRPTSSQALAHEYFSDAVEVIHSRFPQSSKTLGRKQSELIYSPPGQDNAGNPISYSTLPTSSKTSWFRRSFITKPGVEANVVDSVAQQHGQASHGRREPPQPAHPQDSHSGIATAKSPVAASGSSTVQNTKVRGSISSKRATYHGPSAGAVPMQILPSIRPVSPISDAVTVASNNVSNIGKTKSTRLSGQLSFNAANVNIAQFHRQETERALSGKSVLASPSMSQKESFIAQMKKRARRISGRHQTPSSPTPESVDVQPTGGQICSNRSSMALDIPRHSFAKMDSYEHPTDRPADPAPCEDVVPKLPVSIVSPSGNSLKRNYSVHQPRSVDNLMLAAKSPPGPVSSRSRRSQAATTTRLPEERGAAGYSAHKLPPPIDTSSKPSLPAPYLTPSPSVSEHVTGFSDAGVFSSPPDSLGFDSKNSKPRILQSATPPYESDWAVSTYSSLHAVGKGIV